MGKPAARVGDMHVCPMMTPGTPPIPHVGGPLLPPGVPTVLIGGMPAATLGNMATCVGPPDTVALGSTGVFIGGKPAARMGDMCAHGGQIVVGLPTVLIGESSGGAPPVVVVAPGGAITTRESQPNRAAAVVAQKQTLKKAAKNGTPFCEKCAKAAMQAAMIDKDKKSWVEIVLIDVEGEPIADEQYEVILPDGTKLLGETNDEGKARFEGIDIGTCKVTFPNRKAKDWGK